MKRISLILVLVATGCLCSAFVFQPTVAYADADYPDPAVNGIEDALLVDDLILDMDGDPDGAGDGYGADDDGQYSYGDLLGDEGSIEDLIEELEFFLLSVFLPIP